jgi:hypothetical protein
MEEVMSLRFGGLVQVHNELPHNLPRAVASMRRMCDVIVGWDDGSTDGSGEWMDANLDHCFHQPNDWSNEIEHKAKMLRWLQDQSPRVDWILWLDADEALMRDTPDAARALIEKRPDLTGICLSEINLWNDEHHYRVDRQFGDAGFLRLWKNRPELVYPEGFPGLHRPQFPPAARDCIESLGYPAPGILHYSWSSPEKVVAKHARYAAMGQCGESLDRIAPDPFAVRVPVNPDWFT